MNIGKKRIIGLVPVVFLVAGGCSVATTEEVGTTQQAIVGGVQATPGQYPWAVEISQWRSDLGIFVPDCGGSLIAKRWVLTAAHCIRENKEPTGRILDPSEFKITLGEHDLSVAEPSEQIIPVAHVFPHPDFGVSTTISGDIGLIELASDPQLNSRVQIVRLAAATPSPSTNATLTGWGDNFNHTRSDHSMLPPILRALSTVVVGPDQSLTDTGFTCNEGMQVLDLGTHRATDSDEICSYNFHNNDWDGTTLPFDFQSGCNGDSGSPLVVKGASGCTEQIGVHTLGDEFCISWDVATGVAPYLSWIQSKVDGIFEAETMTHSTGGTYPAGWNIWDNGYAAFNTTFAGGQQEMVVTAAGQNGNGWPNMTVSVNGVNVFSTTVTSATFKDYSFSFNAPTGNAQVRVSFTNDFYAPPIDRNLLLDKVRVVNVGRNATCTGASALGARLDVYDDWGAGYCARVNVTNTGATPTTSWNVVVSSGDSNVNQSWNPPGMSGTGNHAFTSVSWNAAINPGATYNQSGFCALRSGSSTTKPVIVSASATY